MRDLFEECAAWARVRDVRAYLDELETEATPTGQHLEGGDLGEWIAWARAQTERINPLRAPLARSTDASES